MARKCSTIAGLALFVSIAHGQVGGGPIGGGGSAANIPFTNGSVVMTAGAAVVTFSKAYTVAPVCLANDTTRVTSPPSPAITLTTLTLTGTAGDTALYVCFGGQQ